MNNASQTDEIEEWKAYLNVLETRMDDAKAALSAYDATKPEECAPYGPWRQKRKEFTQNISGCRHSIETAQIQVKNLESALSSENSSAQRSNISDGVMTTLLTGDVNRLSKEEMELRSLIIRRQERLKTQGHRNDPADNPGKSGGYQPDPGT